MKLKVIWKEKFSITGFGDFVPDMEIEVNEIEWLYLLKNPNFEKIQEAIKETKKETKKMKK